jgi:predicted lipoprotein with Yx(FWY)xxD motif
MSKTLWVVIVIIIIAVAGWFIYKGPSMNNAQLNTTATQTTGTATTNTVFQTANDPAKGAYMADLGGKTLYTFDNDNATPGTSSCTGACAALWPPYMAAAGTDTSSLPANITIITRPDGSMQYAYNGKPLYYYAKDTAAGQLNGDGIGGIWHIVKM